MKIKFNGNYLLAEAILDYRTRTGLSQSEFAKRCGVSKSTISHFETEPDRMLRDITRRRIEHVLNGGRVGDNNEDE